MPKFGRRLVLVVVVVAVALALVVVLLLAPTRFEGSPDSGSMVASATWGLPAEILYRLGGGRIEVVQLLPPGVELHDWEPTPQALEAVRRSRILVWTVHHLDEWGEALARAAGVRSVMAAEQVELVHEDVHFWTRPANLIPVVEYIAEVLASEFPELEGEIRRNAEALKREFTGLDGELQAGLAPLRGRILITQHRSFGYLAEAYGLRYYAVLGPEEEEPSAAYLLELRDLIRREALRTIFAEDGFVHPVVESLARDLGLEIRMLYTGEGLSLEDARESRGYAYLVRQNLEALVAGLGDV